jgi:hypothetical protein
MVDARYELNGDRLRVHPTNKGAELPVVSVISFENGQMVSRPIVDGRAGEGRVTEIRKSRVSRDPGGTESLVGDWVNLGLAGVATYERYSADGQFSLRVPIQGGIQGGRWVCQGRTLELQSGKEVFRLFDIVGERDAMRLREVGGLGVEMTRVAGGCWYMPR